MVTQTRSNQEGSFRQHCCLEFLELSTLLFKSMAIIPPFFLPLDLASFHYLVGLVLMEYCSDGSGEAIRAR